MENIVKWLEFCTFCESEGITNEVAYEFWATYSERYSYEALMPYNWKDLLIRKNETCL